jgi:NAD(P)-dependent dehydrogenase (short-subunit alcohol dehydrogenase family)
MKIKDATVLVTGANRGIGLAFTRELLVRGARKVYAGARDPAAVTQSGVQPASLSLEAFLRRTAKTSRDASSRPTFSACCA